MSAVEASKPAGDTEDDELDHDIPKMEFIESLDKFVQEWGVDATPASGAAPPTASVPVNVASERTVRRLNAMHDRYKTIEARLAAQKARVKSRLPVLHNTLALIDTIEVRRAKNESMRAHVEIGDNLYTVATVPPTENVALWLGADVLLEYPLAEARATLRENIAEAEKHIDSCTKRMDFVKDQVTMTEVNIARVYNWGVQKRKEGEAK